MKNYNLLDEFQNFFGETMFSSKLLKTDIIEDDTNYYLEIEVPGVSKKDLTLDYNEGYLSLTVKTEEEAKNLRYLRKERLSGEYSRSFYLDAADSEKITAKLENGLLFVTVGKLIVVDGKKKICVE